MLEVVLLCEFPQLRFCYFLYRRNGCFRKMRCENLCEMNSRGDNLCSLMIGVCSTFRQIVLSFYGCFPHYEAESFACLVCQSM